MTYTNIASELKDLLLSSATIHQIQGHANLINSGKTPC